MRLLWTAVRKGTTLIKVVTAVILFSLLFLPNCSRRQGNISEEFEFDKKGQLICRTLPDGNKIKYKYNSQGLPIEIDYSDDNVRFGYDANGNRIWMQNKNGKTEYKYDAFDRLVEVSFKYGPEKKIAYAYDPWNRVSSIIISDTQNNIYHVKYEYNVLGSLIGIDDGSGRVEYSYSPDKGEIVRQLPNGIKTVFSYSPAGRLISIRHSDSRNSLLASYRYEYNLAGKISSVLEETPEGSGVTKFEWDSNGYLKTQQLPDGNSLHYQNDARGNRVSVTDSKGTISYTYNDLGRLIRAGDTKFEWDDNGNLMTQVDRNSEIRFRYDGQNLPLLVKTPNQAIRYKWDGDGHMISRDTGKDTSYYLPNPLAHSEFALAEFDSSWKLRSSNLYGDSLLGQRDLNGRVRYYLGDAFNSPRLIADASGKIIGHQDYTHFTQPIFVKSTNIHDPTISKERFLPALQQDFISRNRMPSSSQSNISGFYGPSRYAYSFKPTNIPVGILMVSTKQNMPVFERYGLYGYDRPFRTAWNVATIGLPPIVGAIQGLPEVARAVGGRPSDIGLPVDISYLLGGLLVEGWRSIFTFGSLSLAQAPLVWTNVVLRPVLYGYWNFVFTTFQNTDQMLREAYQQNYFAPDLYNVNVSNTGTKLTTVQTRGFQNEFLPFIGEGVDQDRKKIFKSGDNKGRGPDWPDGGGGGPYGKGGPFGGGYRDPFKSLEAKLGGIKLDSTAQFIGNLGNIGGAVYDPETQVFVLFGDETRLLPSIKAEDLAVALMCVLKGHDPQFSLDPANPRNPRGPSLKAVYIPERVIGGTEFGKALFEADWLLKQYSFGVRLDENGRVQERKSSLREFKSVAALLYEQKDREYGKERWSRFWIVADDMKLKQSGKSIFFDSARMRVKTKKQVPDPQSTTGLKDVDSEDDPVSTRFAKSFTELYEEIAAESPEFERVRQLAKAVAIAKWIKQEGIPFDTNWVNEYANRRIDTVGRITALSTQWERRNETPFQRGNRSGIRTEIHRIHLFGGVDLSVKPRFVSDDGTAKSIQKVVTAKLRGKVLEPIFDVNHNGKSYRAVILPITPRGQEIWKISPTREINGTKYQFDNRGDVARKIDSEGNIGEYTWDTNHRLNEFKMAANNGSRVIGTKKNGYSEIAVTNRRDDKFLYRYSPSGYLSEVMVNGRRYAAFSHDGGDTTIDYGDYTERFRYDASGYVRRYEIHSHREGVPSRKPQILDVRYDKDGQVTEVHGSDTEHVKLTYFSGKIRTVSTSRGKVDYLHETRTGRIEQIDTTWGESTKYSYDGSDLAQIVYKNSEYQKGIAFKGNLPVEVKDNNGELTKYRYSANGFLEQILDPTGTSESYVYDRRNRIKTISLPDGASLNFRYEWYSSKGLEEPIIKNVKITRVSARKSSSSVTGSKSTRPEKVADISEYLAKRLEDIREAGRHLKGGSIVDIFVGEKDDVHVNIVHAGGDVQSLNPESSKELRILLKSTSTMHGKLGNSLLDRWQKFYNSNLSRHTQSTSWTCPDGRDVKIKPVLIIKANEVNYKYANLEKVPALVDNFIVFIASKAKEIDGTPETSAKNLVAKINNIPKLTHNNVAFIIRLPEMSKKEQEKWYREINNLQGLLGKNSVLVDPSKEEFQNMLQNSGKGIVVFELTHTDGGILLKNGERYTSKDIKQSSDLSHIKYLISGLGTCSIPRLEDGKFAASLRDKGVGIINASYREVSSDNALSRLIELINILGSIKEYNLYPYQLIDVIDQRLGISGQETINLGKEERTNCIIG